MSSLGLKTRIKVDVFPCSRIISLMGSETRVTSLVMKSSLVDLLPKIFCRSDDRVTSISPLVAGSRPASVFHRIAQLEEQRRKKTLSSLLGFNFTLRSDERDTSPYKRVVVGSSPTVHPRGVRSSTVEHVMFSLSNLLGGFFEAARKGLLHLVDAHAPFSIFSSFILRGSKERVPSRWLQDAIRQKPFSSLLPI